MRKPVLISTLLLSSFILSNCATSEGDNSEFSDDIVLMPSLSRNTNRGKANPKEASPDSTDVTAQATSTPSPTPAQQEAALKTLAEQEKTQQSASANNLAHSPAPVPTTDPTLTPTTGQENIPVSKLTNVPLLNPEADIEAPAPPPPNEVELQGLRSPKMPEQLPMKF